MITTSLGKLKMHSPNLTQENIARIRELFPNCVTEASGENGKIKLAVDFDLLRQELAESIVEGPQERYRLDWPGKREALLTANAPIAKTLRPCREESVDFDTTKNLYVEGDNLDALKLLQETYLGKVKMIYIDPPYNTGNDFIYEDDFAENTDEFLKRSNQKDEEGNRLVANTESNGRFHSDWLSMMYPRLKLARNLLRDDGMIFVSINENEITNIRRVCDEIFGDKNHVATFVWKNKYGPGALTRGVASLHEYIVCYAKIYPSNIESNLNEEDIQKYKLQDEKILSRGGYITQPLMTRSKDHRPNLIYPLIHNGNEIWPEKQWIWSKERLYSAYNNNEIVVNQKNNKYSVRFKQYLKDEKGVLRKGKPLSLIMSPFNQDGTKEMEAMLGAEIFDFPKPSMLVKYLLSFRVNEIDDTNFIALDFFSGSATTAHAVMQLNAEDNGNRQFIMVQLPEPCDEKSETYKAGYKTIAEIGKERIRRAGAKIKAELAAQQSQNAQGSLLDHDAPRSTPLDIGFRVLKVDSSNMADVYYTPDRLNQSMLDMITDNIKLGRTPEDLLFQVLLDWGVDLTLPIHKETILGKTVFFVDENALVACFDTGLTEELVKELARAKPLRVVFRDNGFSSDADKINATQIFRQLSPGTEVKVI